jgi:hypothetical protein
MAKKSSWIQGLFTSLLSVIIGTVAGIGSIVASYGQETVKSAEPVSETLVAKVSEKELDKQSVQTGVPAKPPVPAVKPTAKDDGALSVRPNQLTASAAASTSWQWIPLKDDVMERFRMELPDIGGLPLLYLALLHDDAEWISQLIANGADANEVTPGGDTMLCAAIRYGCENSVRALLYGGAKVDMQNFEKQPPIALASLRRGKDMLRALLAAGADPNTRFASPVAKELLARVTIKDLQRTLSYDRGVTPLIACAARGDVEGATDLINGGARTNVCTMREKRYPINFAAVQGYLFLMRIILGRQPDSEPEILVTIDLSRQRAWVVKEGKVVDSCIISTGRKGYATPAGRYVITDKHRSWTSTLYHCAMPFFMRLNCGAIGMHSGYVTGAPASHGCIRLPYEKAKSFFGICRVGDEVQIVY